MEIPYNDFIEMVKLKGKVFASPSHEQSHPCHISQFAILEWQYDGGLFAVTMDGRRVECSPNMPAFNLYTKDGE